MDVPSFVEGAIAPTFTIFKEDGSLDDDGQRRFMDFLVEHKGINAFFVRSGMGLMYTFSMDDTRQIARNICAHLKGITPVLVGCSGIWDRNYDRRPDPQLYIEQGLELGNFALEAGAAGVVYTIPEALLPEAGETHQQLLERYFEMICAGVNGPVFLYQPPGTLKEYEMAPATLARLASMDNFVAGKFSTADGFYTYELLRAVRDKTFGYIVGNETLYYAGLVLGARACIGQGTMLNPQIIKAAYECLCNGDPDGMLQAQDAINTLVLEISNPVDFLKLYATEKGYDVPLHTRSQSTNPYMTDRPLITREEYARFKEVYEAILAPYL
ncbi:MAG: putative 2-keto-3-deoxy-galactonate aldolase YagE [Candidatus Hydrogenedentes bacterium ADurb.Bin101]|nr:MAG: putative 2-keto-3-deoxy-galactonate aldolase YagE [Candidatus Hydrogenedentes bacterium ADurb.Bin101]HOC70489.1 dihydrodipicolinate synthase family protein [Candidatus Hydrogenedentota bacterium]HOH28169.1 dihydrodipicolinate synthase family protein [Candidatus Hydrogenedentota bacterium]